MELEEEPSRVLKTRPGQWLIGLMVVLVGCATAPPAGVDLGKEHESPTPDPLAFSFYVVAKSAELRNDPARAARALRRAVEIDSTSATLHRLLARNLASLDRFDEALAPSTRAVELDPDHLENRWVRYNALLSGALDTAAAIAELDRIAVRSTNPIRALDTRLRIHTKQQDRAGVVAVLDRIVTLPNLDDRGRQIAAQNYRRNGEPAKAEALLRDVLSRQPQLGDAWVQLGGIIGSRGDTLAAARAYRKGVAYISGDQLRQVWRQLVSIYVRPHAFEALIAETPVDAPFTEQLADVFRSFGRGTNDDRQRSALYQRALNLLNHLSSLFPARSELHAKSGELLLNLNQGKNAREAFERASSIDNRPEYRVGFAHGLILDGEYESAIDELTAALDHTPPSDARHQITLTLGNAHSALGQNAEARRVFETALEADPDHLGFGFERAQTFVREQNWNAAVEAFAALMPGVESNAGLLQQTLYGLARANERSGNFDTAVRKFERLIALDPSHDEALNYLGYMFAEKGVRLGEALQFIQRALDQEPNNGAYLDSMGWAYYQLGELERAREYLQKAIAIEERAMQALTDADPRHLAGMRENLAVIHEHAGDVAAALEQKDQAREHWSKARSYDPDNETLVKKLGTLDASETDRETP